MTADLELKLVEFNGTIMAIAPMWG